MVTLKKEAVTPRNIVQGLLRVAGKDVLVGGQALAVWVEIYGVKIPSKVAAISHDVDFLTGSPTAKESITRYASVMGGSAYVYSNDRITALVGQAYKNISEDEMINVDVLWDVIGLKPQVVRKNAVTATRDEISFLVMHPMDVLRSRLINLYKLPSKQDEKGVMQLRLAIAVVRAYLIEQAKHFSDDDNAQGRSPIQTLISAVEKLAIDDAGRKIAQRYGVHVADAIDPTSIPAGPFWEKKWADIKGLMSPRYGARFTPPASIIDQPRMRF